MKRHFFRTLILCSVCVGTLALTYASQSLTQDESPIFFGGTGGELLKRCNAIGTLKVGGRVTASQLSDIVKDSNLCWGYVAGLVDGYQFAGLSKPRQGFCVPESVDIEQLEKVVKKYLDDNPARLHLPAGALIIFALDEAFPCK